MGLANSDENKEEGESFARANATLPPILAESLIMRFTKRCKLKIVILAFLLPPLGFAGRKSQREILSLQCKIWVVSMDRE